MHKIKVEITATFQTYVHVMDADDAEAEIQHKVDRLEQFINDFHPIDWSAKLGKPQTLN